MTLQNLSVIQSSIESWLLVSLKINIYYTESKITFFHCKISLPTLHIEVLAFLSVRNKTKISYLFKTVKQLSHQQYFYFIQQQYLGAVLKKATLSGKWHSYWFNMIQSHIILLDNSIHYSNSVMQDILYSLIFCFSANIIS